MKYPTIKASWPLNLLTMKSNLFLYIFLLFIHYSFSQNAIPEPGNYLVNDYAQLLDNQEILNLDNKLKAYARETSTQIVIVIQNSTDGEDIFDHSLRIAQSWGIGQKGKDNGVLLYIAVEDRKLFIQTGYGAEGFLPDAMSKRIIENVIKPSFRAGNFYNGLDEATNIIMDLGRGEYTAEDWDKKTSSGGIPAIFILVFIIVLIIIISNFNQDDDDDDDGGYYRNGRYDMDERGLNKRKRRGGGWIFFPGPGSGGGWSGGGGFGGGGFGGFGGGGFGGGGAGGEW